MRTALLGLSLVLVLVLTACQPRIQVDIGGGVERDLVAQTVSTDPGSTGAQVAMIEVRGLLVDARKPDLFGQGPNPVDRFVSLLDKAEKDPEIKAIIVRINSPGGTVTASDIMHEELRRFVRNTRKPAVACLGEIAASGGYYLALGCDHIVAQPTTITGSIGVIVPTVNVSEGLNRIGIQSRSVKSGRMKDMGNPLEPIRDDQYAVLQGLVDEYFARFKALALERRHIKPDEADMVTDGRVFSGERAVAVGLADEVGGVREAFAAAKRLAGLQAATLVKFTDRDNPPRSAYSRAGMPAATSAGPGLSLQLNLPEPMAAGETSGFYYLWAPFLP